MKEVKLKFIGLGYNNLYQANIKIYKGNTLVYKGKTYNSELTVCLKEHTLYKLIATSIDEVINTNFYVYNDEYIFVFNRGRYQTNNRTITFLLTDYYYNNLPIERGEIILWQR